MAKIPVYRLKLNKDKSVKLDIERYINKEGSVELTEPSDVTEFFRQEFNMDEFAEEEMFAVYVAADKTAIGVANVSHGTSTTTSVNERGIFIRALLMNAVGIILVHNHPSGLCSPSVYDIESTRKFLDGCNLLGLSLIDHVIVGKQGLSMRDCCSSIWKEGGSK